MRPKTPLLRHINIRKLFHVFEPNQPRHLARRPQFHSLNPRKKTCHPERSEESRRPQCFATLAQRTTIPNAPPVAASFSWAI
jgi:hypothetical protein